MGKMNEITHSVNMKSIMALGLKIRRSTGFQEPHETAPGMT